MLRAMLSLLVAVGAVAAGWTCVWPSRLQPPGLFSMPMFWPQLSHYLSAAPAHRHAGNARHLQLLPLPHLGITTTCAAAKSAKSPLLLHGSARARRSSLKTTSKHNAISLQGWTANDWPVHYMGMGLSFMPRYLLGLAHCYALQSICFVAGRAASSTDTSQIADPKNVGFHSRSYDYISLNGFSLISLSPVSYDDSPCKKRVSIAMLRTQFSNRDEIHVAPIQASPSRPEIDEPIVSPKLAFLNDFFCMNPCR